MRLSRDSRAHASRLLLRAALLLLALGLGTETLAADERVEKELDVRIHLRMSWEDVGKLGNVNIWESGKAIFDVGGRVELEGDAGPTLAYVPKSLHASWTWQHVYRVSPKVRAVDACPAGSVLSIETSTGSRPLDEGDMTLQVILGKAAGMAASAYGGSPDTDGMYVLMVQKLIDTTVRQQQKDCFPAPYPTGTSGKRHFLLHAQGAMKDGRIRGTHHWTQQERVSVGSLDAQILDLGPSPIRSGDKPNGNVRIDVTYRAGRPRALQIQRRAFDTWQDVTYEEGDSPVDVLVGERMELRAVLLPNEEEVSDGQWKIPAPAVEDWIVKGAPHGYGTATVDELEAPELEGGTVRFHWWGASGERTVSMETKTGGAKRAEARFRVKEPQTRVRTVVPLAAKFQIVMKPNGKEELVCIVEGEPTITFRHEPVSWTTPGETQYVQLVKTDARTEMGTSSNKGSCMELHAEGLDDSYPYAPGPRAADNPGVPADTIDLKLLASYDFEMFLMYRPDTEGAIWVPLRVVPWSWHGRAVRAQEGGTWDVSGSSMSREPVDARADRFPTWTLVDAGDQHWSPCSD